MLACCTSECEPDETRCHGNKVEVCNGDGEWCEVMNCDELGDDGAAWTCCLVDLEDWDFGDVHTCLPAEQCIETDR
ncbi:MAG: hypothetical protein GY854_17760 [Deltaproteobacteria bacterium]|nr:hypothetical protein [Deltaproteobacteria bacterium]